MPSIIDAAQRRLQAIPPQMRASLLIILSTLGFTGMHTVIRYASTVGDTIHPFEIAFFRNLFGLIVLAPIFWRSRFGVLRTQKFHLHALRGTIQIFAMLMFFTALSLSPLAKVSAMSFTAPLFATIGAIVFLGERIRMRRIMALLLGFAGALIILQPGVVELDPGMLLVLTSSAIWACAMLIIKVLSRTDSSVTITAYQGIFLTPLSLIAALFVWDWPNWHQLALFALMGVLGTLAHVSMAEAFKLADTTAVLPFDFTRLIWASMVGFLVFGEVPALWTWVGGTVIFASTTYIAYREARLSRKSG
jgi:drug/metabolite transporter (DMT)-like permease